MFFSGSRTNEPAFTLEDDNTITYNGDDSPFSIKIGDSTVGIGNDGDDIFKQFIQYPR